RRRRRDLPPEAGRQPQAVRASHRLARRLEGALGDHARGWWPLRRPARDGGRRPPAPMHVDPVGRSGRRGARAVKDISRKKKLTELRAQLERLTDINVAAIRDERGIPDVADAGVVLDNRANAESYYTVHALLG